MSTRKRRIEANYLKVGEGFKLLGTGFTALNEKPSAKTTSKRYINDASATQSITSYEWSAEYESEQIADDEVVEYIRYIGKKGLTGADAETEYINVELDKVGADAGTFKAFKRKVAVQVDGFTDNDGEMGVTGSFLGIGDPVEGTFNPTTKAFTELKPAITK